MKQIVYTCFRCDKQAKTAVSPDEVPLEWAAIHYERFHEIREGEETQTVRTTVNTHACGDCARGVFDYLEPPSPLRAA